MQKRFHKYFWDGLENWGADYELKRILEYASFPDMLKYPFEEVKENLHKLNLEKLWTSGERKELIIKLAPFVTDTNSWEEAIWAMINFHNKSSIEE